MKKIVFTFSLLFLFNFCTGQITVGKPEVNPASIQKSYLIWKSYQSKILLSRAFTAFDANSKKITLNKFLELLSQGNYIPVRLKSDETTFSYQLFPILPTSDSSIKASIVEIAYNEIENIKKEGKPFPAFSFKDLKGNLITNENLRGKIVVLKCWYIHCAACLKEFPDVNNLVRSYQARKDIVFISLAEDTPEQLQPFLLRKPLLYSVVPNMKSYMNLTLQLNAFPTHFIIDKNGIIKKVVSDSKNLEIVLKKVSAKE